MSSLLRMSLLPPLSARTVSRSTGFVRRTKGDEDAILSAFSTRKPRQIDLTHRIETSLAPTPSRQTIATHHRDTLPRRCRRRTPLELNHRWLRGGPLGLARLWAPSMSVDNFETQTDPTISVTRLLLQPIT